MSRYRTVLKPWCEANGIKMQTAEVGWGKLGGTTMGILAECGWVHPVTLPIYLFFWYEPQSKNWDAQVALYW